MSKRKYKRGAQLKTLDRFWNFGETFYVVRTFVYWTTNEAGVHIPIWKEKTYHKGWLASMQFRTLANMIRDGRVYTARKIKENEQ